jgi:preprotein translocase subunit SecE
MSKDDATWLNACYVTFGLLMAYFGYKAVEMIGLQNNWAERYEWFDGVATVIGVVIGAACALFLRSNPERHEYMLASIGELRKVTWPSWDETKRMTTIVVVVVAIFGVVLGIFDVLWSKALNLLIA